MPKRTVYIKLKRENIKESNFRRLSQISSVFLCSNELEESVVESKKSYDELKAEMNEITDKLNEFSQNNKNISEECANIKK